MSNSSPQNSGVSTVRIISLGVIFLALSIYYLIYLFFMQVVDLDVYERRADLVTKRNQVVPAKRGQIFDRNIDRPVASNFDSFVVTLNPETMTLEEVLSVIERVSPVLGQSPESLKKKLPKGNKFYQSLELATGVSYTTIVKIAEDLDNLPGISWYSKPIRSYSTGSDLAHIVGYVGEITPDELKVFYNKGYTTNSIIGKDGIEKRYDDYLRGKEGVRFRRVDAQGRGISDGQEILVAPESGKNLVLTVDSRIQNLAVRSLGHRIGSVVVLKPFTGEVLAMVSYPTYDPNLFYSDKAAQVFSRLSRDSYGPFFNRAIQSAASPASTFKVVMSAAVIDTGVVPISKKILCLGNVKVGNRVFNCHLRTGHGYLDLYGALAQSCNIYYYTIGNEYLGVDNIVDYSYRFGFGEYSGIDIPGEISGLVPTPEWKQQSLKTPWVGGDTVNLSIGQGFLQTTPIQLANMMAMIVTDGTTYQPHILKEVRDPTTNTVIETISPKILRQSQFKPGTLNELRNALRNVIITGTPSSVITTKAVKVAGKTGTAQTGRGEDDQHSWFVAYGPFDYEDPEDVVAVVVWVDAVNPWEWWAPKAANLIFHGIFSDLDYEETVKDLQPLWYLSSPEPWEIVEGAQ